MEEEQQKRRSKEHHHHHHHHSSVAADEKVTWKDIFSKPKYSDDTSQMRFYMEKRRKLRGFRQRLIFSCVAIAALVVLACVFFAYFIDR